MKRLEYWRGDWSSRALNAVLDRGCQTMSEFLSRFPGRPYHELAAELGNVVAPLQLLYVQLSEATSETAMRSAAMDCLCREINEAFPRGWVRSGPKSWSSCSARFRSVAHAASYADSGCGKFTKSQKRGQH